jgi:hypothetical protein
MGNPQNTWSKGKKGKVFCWPKDGLPDKLPKAQILLYGYDVDVIKPLQATQQSSITHHANNLLVRLERKLPKDKPIIFVCHSLGGILLKDVLEQSRSSDDPDYRLVHANTRCVVFMGTPHRGSAAANVGQIATRIAKAFLRNPNENILRNLEQGSELLSRIHDKFMRMLIKPEFQVHCFQEDRGITGIRGLDGLIVDFFSSKTESPFEICETLTANHMDMVAYEGPTDPNYQNVSDALVKYYQKILNEPNCACCG